MNRRLQEIIKYKTGGRQKDFAELMGWTPQYVTKLLRGDNFGLTPVMTLLDKLPEINARWFMLGQGEMLEIGKIFNIQREAFAQVRSLLDLERYIPFMSPDDIASFEKAVANGQIPVFSPVQLTAWEEQANARKQEENAIFAAAQAKSKELCRTRTAKK